MTIVLANAVANFADAPAPPVDWASWAQAALLALAILGAALIVRGRPRPDYVTPRKDFARFVRSGVEERTRELRAVFASKLHESPQSFPEAQEYLRGLRKDLRYATGFIERVDKRAFEGWPKFELYEAFHKWAEPIRYTDRLLADMLGDLQTAADKSLVGPLLEQYRRDEWRIRLDLEDLDKRSAAVVAAAKAIEEPEKS